MAVRDGVIEEARCVHGSNNKPERDDVKMNRHRVPDPQCASPAAPLAKAHADLDRRDEEFSRLLAGNKLNRSLIDYNETLARMFILFR